MRKVLSLVLAAMLLLCGASFALAEEADGVNELTISYGLKPNLDIHWNAGTDGAHLQSVMYEGLYRYTDTGFELAGADSYEVSEDGLTWTYKLKEEAKWNDGNPVTAGDYVYSMKRLVDPAVSSIYMLDYGQFLKNGTAISNGEMELDDLGVSAIDDYTLEIQLEEPIPFFDAILCYTAYYPLRADMVTEDGTGYWAWDVDRSVTNGPMKMVSCDEEQEIVFEKNEHYYNIDAVALDRLVVKLVDDNNTRLSLLTTGAVDMIFSYPSEDTEKMKEEGYYHSVPSWMTRFLLVNTEKEGLNDPDVRKALSMAIDRDFLATTLLSVQIPATAYVGNGFPGSSSEKDFRDEGGPLLTYDVEGAKELLAQAGYPDGDGFPVIECAYSNASADYTIVFEYLQACWEELGLTVILSPTENAAMTELRDAGNFDITPQGWGADYLDASNMLSIFVTGNFINAGKYSNKTFDQYYEDAIKTLDASERANLLHEAERVLIVEDMGTIPLYHSPTYALYKDDVCTNVTYDANGKVRLVDVVVTK